LAQQTAALTLGKKKGDNDEVKKKPEKSPATKNYWVIRIDENFKYDDIARKLYTLEPEEYDKVITKVELMRKGQYVVWCPLEAQKQKLAAAEVEKKAAAKNYKEMQAQLNAMLDAAKQDPHDEDEVPA